MVGGICTPIRLLYASVKLGGVKRISRGARCRRAAQCTVMMTIVGLEGLSLTYLYSMASFRAPGMVTLF